MQKYRKQIRDVLEVLTYVTEPFDPDGLDLWFATSNQRYRPKTKYINSLVDGMEFAAISNLQKRLSTILEKFIAELDETHRMRRVFDKRRPKIGSWPLRLYILTDGVCDSELDLRSMIANLVRTMQRHGLFDRKVGIQFICFGNDPGRKRHFQDLNKQVKKDVGW